MLQLPLGQTLQTDSVTTGRMDELKVVARGSKLSRLQVEEVFRNFPHLRYRAEWLSTPGDRDKTLSLLDGQAPQDFFTRDIDEAVATGQADIAVHSAKDLPYPLDPRLEVVALLAATDTTDSLVSRDNLPLSKLPAGSRIGTSSQTRKRELLAARPDLTVESIRGSIEERIAQVRSGWFDAAIVATCALKRLGLEREIAEVLPFETHPLQGFLAVTARKGTELRTLFADANLLDRQGSVTIVGAGPGNPDLLTIAGDKALRAADIIFYDDLLDKQNLRNYRAKQVYVGKRSGRHSTEQSEINRLLLNAAREGKQVVRLKGGDPAVFARTGEEVEFLRKNLIEVSIIPGISAASALAASAGIGLTRRGLSSSVAFVNGHDSETTLSRPETLCFYMGAARLSQIANQLIGAGWPMNSPVLLGYNLSRPDEQIFKSTLSQLTESNHQYPTPLLMLVGDTVRTTTQAADDIRRTLYNGTVCPNPDYIHTPLIEIEPLGEGSSEATRLDEALANISAYRYLLFTSRNTVDSVLSRPFDRGALGKLRVVTIGKTTTAAVRKWGINHTESPVTPDSFGIIEYFKTLPRARVLYPRSDRALPLIFDSLTKMGFDVDAPTAYHTRSAANPTRINLKNISHIVFTSPSTIDSFRRVYGELPPDKQYIVQGCTTRSHLLKYIKTTDTIITRL